MPLPPFATLRLTPGPALGLALGLAIVLALAAAPAAAQGMRATDGLIPEAEVIAQPMTLPPDQMEALFETLYQTFPSPVVRPCAKGLTRADVMTANDIDPTSDFDFATIRLEADLPLERRHAGDLTCALAEAGHWVAGREAAEDGRTLLTVIVGGAEIWQVEVTLTGETVTQVHRLRPVRGDFVPAPPGLEVFAALLGQAETDAFTPPRDPAPDEPGCAETGACPVLACGPAIGDSDFLRAALFDAQMKADVCDRLRAYQTQRHDPGPPSDAVFRRLMVIAALQANPEIDVTEGGARVIVEHSAAGYRLVGTNALGLGLFSTPRLSWAIRDVTGTACTGPEAGPLDCTAQVEVETFGVAPQIPAGPQREMLERLFGGEGLYTVTVAARLVRSDARWGLSDPEAVSAQLHGADPETVGRSVTESMVEGLAGR